PSSQQRHTEIIDDVPSVGSSSQDRRHDGAGVLEHVLALRVRVRDTAGPYRCRPAGALVPESLQIQICEAVRAEHSESERERSDGNGTTSKFVGGRVAGT